MRGMRAVWKIRAATEDMAATPPLLVAAGVFRSDHRQVGIMVRGRVAMVDVGIAELIRTLWRHRIETRYSCQGGFDPKTGEVAEAYIAFPHPIEFARFECLVENCPPAWKETGSPHLPHVLRFPPAGIDWLTAQLKGTALPPEGHSSPPDHGRSGPAVRCTL
ncbi:hypothetical protein [Parafrankia sp. FMc2]|uniref:hypothetical protein n=1 Tax=Parafrankia sp. FMc2 TaxID=3233196 RepID=UPI0034D668EA